MFIGGRTSKQLAMQNSIAEPAPTEPAVYQEPAPDAEDIVLTTDNADLKEKQTTQVTIDSKGEVFGEEESHHDSQSCGRGIIKDFRYTVMPNWKKQMINFNQKTIAVAFFMFFAAVAPAITFGAVYAKATNNYFGAVEMLLSSAWCGILYALIGGQPIVSDDVCLGKKPNQLLPC